MYVVCACACEQTDASSKRATRRRSTRLAAERATTVLGDLEDIPTYKLVGVYMYIDICIYMSGILCVGVFACVWVIACVPV